LRKNTREFGWHSRSFRAACTSSAMTCLIAHDMPRQGQATGSLHVDGIKRPNQFPRLASKISEQARKIRRVPFSNDLLVVWISAFVNEEKDERFPLAKSGPDFRNRPRPVVGELRGPKIQPCGHLNCRKPRAKRASFAPTSILSLNISSSCAEALETAILTNPRTMQHRLSKNSPLTWPSSGEEEC